VVKSGEERRHVPVSSISLSAGIAFTTSKFSAVFNELQQNNVFHKNFSLKEFLLSVENTNNL